jgi:TATA-box binding protein (TBP) (component of TFIID and TFIIIB)
MLEYTVTNIVIIAKTHGRHTLSKVFEKVHFGVYNPKNFSALTLKHVNPKIAIVMFSTGHITIMGAKSVWAAMYTILKLKEKIGMDVVFVSVKNMVATLSLKDLAKKINIQELYARDKINCMCDADTFPSCTYNVPDTNIKANFFNSGKVVIAGCTSDKELQSTTMHIIDRVLPML